MLRSLRLFVKKRIKKQLSSYPSNELSNRMKILNTCNINAILDVGANTGGFGEEMIELGYKGKIISFEPTTNAFKKLIGTAKKFNNWEIKNYALGSENTKTTINVSENSLSSSLLKILPSHVESAPESRYISEEEIEIKTLDSIYSTLGLDNNKILLKIDTQGYEKYVLEGAIKTLPSISMIHIEMSLVPLYSDSILFLEMIEYLKLKGFDLYSIESVFSNPNTGQLLQVDGVFVNRNLLSN